MICDFCSFRRAVVDAFCGSGHRPQFALIKKACEAYGLETVEGTGFEADDAIASFALEVS